MSQVQACVYKCLKCQAQRARSSGCCSGVSCLALAACLGGHLCILDIGLLITRWLLLLGFVRLRFYLLCFAFVRCESDSPLCW